VRFALAIEVPFDKTLEQTFESMRRLT